MAKTITDRRIILKEWEWIYANFPRFQLILDMKNIITSNNSLGINVGHIKESNYSELYNSIIDRETYSICLLDYSLICMNYSFDNKGKIVSHNLMYIPCPTKEDENESLEETMSKYIRIDYDLLGYKKTIHTQVHLHTNVYKSKMRIPLQHIVSPKDFLFIVLKYIYNSDEDIVDTLLSKKTRNNILEDDDKTKLRIALGD